MSKTITEQIADLEQENQKLREFQKLFDKAVKLEFGISTKQLHNLIETQTDFITVFVSKLASYFNLETSEDLDKFIEIFCNEPTLNHYNELISEEHE